MNNYKYLIYFRKTDNGWRIMKIYKYITTQIMEKIFGEDTYRVLEGDVRFLSEINGYCKYMVALRDNARFSNDFIHKNNPAVNCKKLLLGNEELVEMIGIENIIFK